MILPLPHTQSLAVCDVALATHMGKILECGAFFSRAICDGCDDGFSEHRSLCLGAGIPGPQGITQVGCPAHSLYEREDPFLQRGPGGAVDLSSCRFEADGERRVRVSGARFIRDDGYRVKLEGAAMVGYRSLCMAGVRCPTMIERLDELLNNAHQKTINQFAPDKVLPTFRVYGRDGVMSTLEPLRQQSTSHELGLLMDVTAPTQELAHAACHFLSGHLLHVAYPGQINTSGNLAFPYSPSDVDAGAVYEFSIYHLMKAATPTELFPIHHDHV